MTRMTKAGLLLGLMTMAAAPPAYAAPGCWDQTQAAAAKIRDLQSRLMVATLRCQAMGVDISPSYNAFVRTSRTTLQAANGAIKARFAASHGVAASQTQYDRFTTALANAYGGDATNAGICAANAAVAKEAAAANGDIGRLLTIVQRMGPSPSLPGGECPVSFALAK